jgi:hypothetical protein
VSIHSKFKALVRELDQPALEELGKLVASELSRQSKAAFQMDQIHPRMTPAEKERAAREIAEVLKGQS